MADEGPSLRKHGDATASQTDWAVIHEAGRAPATPAGDAWESLARRYWPAIYAFIRRSGRDVHEAADLTQGFVCDVMLGRELVAQADPARGRFRAFLRTAVRNYLAERHRHDSRQKRAPDTHPALDLDVETARGLEIGEGSPESAFDAQWGVAIVHRVLDEMRSACEAEELGTHWTVFEERVARPMLLGATPVPYDQLVERLDLKDQAQAANMMITVKRRFARALRDAVAATVQDPADVEDELHELLRSLERRA